MQLLLMNLYVTSGVHFCAILFPFCIVVNGNVVYTILVVKPNILIKRTSVKISSLNYRTVKVWCEKLLFCARYFPAKSNCYFSEVSKQKCRNKHVYNIMHLWIYWQAK